MWISEKEKEILVENVKFLIDNDFELEVEEYGISLSNTLIKIVVGFPPMSDISEVGIRFKKENQYFDIGWIAAVRDNLVVNCYDKLNGAIQLLKYLEDNYENIVNHEYCVESEKLISGYLQNLKVTKRK